MSRKIIQQYFSVILDITCNAIGSCGLQSFPTNHDGISSCSLCSSWICHGAQWLYFGFSPDEWCSTVQYEDYCLADTIMPGDYSVNNSKSACATTILYLIYRPLAPQLVIIQKFIFKFTVVHAIVGYISGVLHLLTSLHPRVDALHHSSAFGPNSEIRFVHEFALAAWNYCENIVPVEV